MQEANAKTVAEYIASLREHQAPRASDVDWLRTLLRVAGKRRSGLTAADVERLRQTYGGTRE